MYSTAGWVRLQARFAERILPVGNRVADEWGRLNALTPRNTIDSLIAATARVHGLTVVTRNTKDFEGCHVHMVNPWNHDR